MSSRTKTTSRNGTACLHVTALDDDLAYITAVPAAHDDPQQAAAAVYGKVAEFLADLRMEIVHERVFGSLVSHERVLAGRRIALLAGGVSAETPASYLQGRPFWGEGLAGVNLMAVGATSPKAVWTIADKSGVPSGRAWRRHGATFLFLQSMHGRVEGNGADNSRDAQADRMFLRADELLRSQKTSYQNVTRTWIYLSKILDWYNDFNSVRSRRYAALGLMPEPEEAGGNHLLLPASTGIEGYGPAGAAAAMDVLATVLEPDSPIEIHQMTNRKQKDAFRYGSAFSRGAAIRMPQATWISISGTAAIDEDGVSLLPGDFRGQMNQTLDTIEALIAQEGATLADLCDVSLFVKRPEDAAACGEVLAERGLQDLPGVPVIADVCRDDLLFEADGAAVVAKT